MNTILVAIALLCQIPNGNTYKTVTEIEIKQLQCQQGYIKCVEITNNLITCIKKRRIK